MQIRLVLEYDGTNYCGWQIQRDERTVQGVLEEALARYLGHATRAVAAGRTDSGVHAAGQVVSFHTHRQVAPDTTLRALNALTPSDLTVREADVVPATFDPRRSATSRVYVYRLWNRASPSPFWQRYSWHIRVPLDVDAMTLGAATLVGEHDFSSFRAAGCDAAHPIRRVTRSQVVRAGDMVLYEIEATAFLRHMVRNITGTLVEVGQHRRAPRLDALLAARNRSLAGMTAPALGLCLASVRYGDGESLTG